MDNLTHTLTGIALARCVFDKRVPGAAWTLAIGQRLNIRAFAGIVVPYPTLAEVGKRAALSYFTPSLTNNMVRRVIVWLRRFG